MRIKVINPNTNRVLTDRIGATARAVAAPDTEIVATVPEAGPSAIESHYDLALAAVGLLQEVRDGERQSIDGYVLACFGDPGLNAAREIAPGPVVGMAEAAMHAASYLATKFSIVTTLERMRIVAERLVVSSGMERHCRGIHVIDMPISALADSRSNVKGRLIEACRKALHEDRSGAIVLGSGGMAGLGPELSRELGCPVIDGIAVAVKLVEGLVSLGLSTGRVFDLAPPGPKAYSGILAPFSPE
jgi:allantoin racemase